MFSFVLISFFTVDLFRFLWGFSTYTMTWKNTVTLLSHWNWIYLLFIHLFIPTQSKRLEMRQVSSSQLPNKT